MPFRRMERLISLGFESGPLGATFKFYKQKSFTSQPLGKPKEQFQNILQYLALETLISTTFRMLEYYNANDEVEQMIRRLFRCQ